MKKDVILINKVILENIFLRYEKDSTKWVPQGFYLCLSTIATLLLSKVTTDNYGTFLWLNAQGSEMLINIVLLILSILCVVLGVIWYSYSRNNKILTTDALQNEIIEGNIYEEDYTYILLFPKYDKSQFYFLVQKKDNWGNSFFFPYLKHKYGDANISENEVKIIDEIKKKYRIEIPIGIKEITDNPILVTKLKSGLPKDFHFRFLYVGSISPFFHTFLLEHMLNSYSWMTIEEMNKDKITCINNGDVLNAIEDNLSTIRRYYDESRNEKTKLIWNIDKRCNNACNICVYGDSFMQTTDKDELLSIADSILSVDVNEIDLSMGNGANIEHIKAVVEHIKRKSKVDVSITATADVLLQIGVDFLNKYVSEIEITYDYPHDKDWHSGIRPSNYNKENFEIARTFYKEKHNFKIVINIVLHEDMNTQELKTILKDLKLNGFFKYNFLRLMPLGNLTLDRYPHKLFERKFYEDVFKISKKANPHIHCALRGLTNNNSQCRMGHSKLGISPNGDVYVCAWAEHIHKDEENPFYVGNLDEDVNLQQLLVNNSNFVSIIEHNQTKDCKLFSFLQGRDMWSEKDKLYN